MIDLFPIRFCVFVYSNGLLNWNQVSKKTTKKKEDRHVSVCLCLGVSVGPVPSSEGFHFLKFPPIIFDEADRQLFFPALLFIFYLVFIWTFHGLPFCFPGETVIVCVLTE